MNTRALNRFLEGQPNNLLYVNGAFTANITHHTRPILLNVAGGATVSLPTAKGQGLVLWFIVSVVSTTGYIFNTNGTDVFKGGINMNQASTATPVNGYAVSTANKTATLNGTTTGGVAIGDMIELVDILLGVWAISGQVVYSGSIATPFSN